mmetsp:Transcript_2721/g.8141  ORF Transcript_2721/g.8141 Transcript_2721/m.8141 type:complete len:242 (+) Transcript_2721:656-1381(+)
MVHPALAPQLVHDGIDPRVAGPPQLPRPQVLLIRIPVDLSTVWVSFHRPEVWNGNRGTVEKLPPEKLPVQRHGRLCVIWPPRQDLLEPLVEQSRRQTPEFQVRRQQGRRRIWRTGRRVPLWLLKGGHPRLIGQVPVQYNVRVSVHTGAYSSGNRRESAPSFSRGTNMFDPTYLASLARAADSPPCTGLSAPFVCSSPYPISTRVGTLYESSGTTATPPGDGSVDGGSAAGAGGAPALSTIF